MSFLSVLCSYLLNAQIFFVTVKKKENLLQSIYSI